VRITRGTWWLTDGRDQTRQRATVTTGPARLLIANGVAHLANTRYPTVEYALAAAGIGAGT
jgi:hypothetical protein